MKYEKREELRELIKKFQVDLEPYVNDVADVTEENEDDEPTLCLGEALDAIWEDLDALLEEEAL